jgi:CopG family transcriptional regulator/antitoxin EndoAI
MKQAGAMNGFLLQKGWLFVADSKRITVCFPVSLLEEMDLLIDAENKCRSELVREAMRFYLWEKRKLYLREEMRKGYQEMACLNLALVEEFCFCEEEAHLLTERKIMECCL